MTRAIAMTTPDPKPTEQYGNSNFVFKKKKKKKKNYTLLPSRKVFELFTVQIPRLRKRWTVLLGGVVLESAF